MCIRGVDEGEHLREGPTLRILSFVTSAVVAMRRSRLGAAGAAGAALLALPAPAARGQALVPLPFKGGAIAFGVHVQVAPGFTGHVAVDSASFTGTSLADVRGLVVVRADSMHTGIGLRDHHMRDAMETAQYPEIRFELLGVAPAGAAGAAGTTAAHGDTTAVTYIGRMTIHGRTRDDTIPGTLVLRSGKGPGGGATVDAAARFSLDMRDYGIKPPTRFLIIRVQPVVDIAVELRFEAPPTASAKSAPAAGPAGP